MENTYKMYKIHKRYEIRPIKKVEREGKMDKWGRVLKT